MSYIIQDSSLTLLKFYDFQWTLRWRHNERDGISNHQPHDCLLNRLFRPRSKKTSKLRVTGLFAGNSPETGEFPAQMASDAENVSIWWRHHEVIPKVKVTCTEPQQYDKAFQGRYSLRRHHLIGIRIPIIKLRRPPDRSLWGFLYPQEGVFLWIEAQIACMCFVIYCS